MIGEVKLIGRDVYIVMNSGGTLEKMERVGFFTQLWIAVYDYFSGWHPQQLRDFCKEHALNKE
jgi:hypothetical protein